MRHAGLSLLCASNQTLTANTICGRHCQAYWSKTPGNYYQSVPNFGTSSGTDRRTSIQNASSVHKRLVRISHTRHRQRRRIFTLHLRSSVKFTVSWRPQERILVSLLETSCACKRRNAVVVRQSSNTATVLLCSNRQPRQRFKITRTIRRPLPRAGGC